MRREQRVLDTGRFAFTGGHSEGDGLARTAVGVAGHAVVVPCVLCAGTLDAEHAADLVVVQRQGLPRTSVAPGDHRQRTACGRARELGTRAFLDGQILWPHPDGGLFG